MVKTHVNQYFCTHVTPLFPTNPNMKVRTLIETIAKDCHPRYDPTTGYLVKDIKEGCDFPDQSTASKATKTALKCGCLIKIPKRRQMDTGVFFINPPIVQYFYNCLIAEETRLNFRNVPDDVGQIMLVLTSDQKPRDGGEMPTNVDLWFYGFLGELIPKAPTDEIEVKVEPASFYLTPGDKPAYLQITIQTKALPTLDCDAKKRLQDVGKTVHAMLSYESETGELAVPREQVDNQAVRAKEDPEDCGCEKPCLHLTIYFP